MEIFWNLDFPDFSQSFPHASTGSNIEPGVLSLCCNEKNWGKYFFCTVMKKTEHWRRQDSKEMKKPSGVPTKLFLNHLMSNLQELICWGINRVEECISLGMNPSISPF